VIGSRACGRAAGDPARSPVVLDGGDAIAVNRQSSVTLILALLLPALTVALAAAIVAPPAHAGSLTATKARAAQVNAEVRSLDGRVDQAVTAYATAAQRLDALRAQVADGRRQLKLARYQLGVATEQLSRHIVVAYKSGDASILNAVFDTGTFDQLLTKLDYVRHITGTDAGLVSTVSRRKHDLQATLKGLQSRLDAAAEATATLKDERDALRAELAQRQHLLGGLNADVRRQVAEARTVKPTPKAAPSPSPSAPTVVSTGGWWPVIQAAAAANGISANGLDRLMLAESGGSASAVNGPYCGLFQYSRSTWSGSWNPWRGADVFDGASQIKATALAIKLGYGPSWWPATYPWAFSGS